MTPRHLAMGAALLFAAGLLVFGDRTPDSGVAEAVERPAPSASATVVVPVRAAVGEPAILRLAERSTLVGDGEAEMGGPGGVFGRQDWNPPPPPVPEKAVEEAAPPAAPTAPPLPFSYIGKAVEKGSWEVFLARGDKTYVVRDKMVIDGTYRVDAIAPPNLTLTYLPLNQVQQLNIGVLD